MNGKGLLWKEKSKKSYLENIKDIFLATARISVHQFYSVLYFRPIEQYKIMKGELYNSSNLSTEYY